MDVFGNIGKVFANQAKIKRSLELIKQDWTIIEPTITKLRETWPELFALGRDLIAVFAPQAQMYLAGVAPLATVNVRDLQDKLYGLSYYDGESDNDYGEHTQAAVKKFQGDKGLEPDGWAAMGETLPAIWVAYAEAEKKGTLRQRKATKAK